MLDSDNLIVYHIFEKRQLYYRNEVNVLKIDIGKLDLLIAETGMSLKEFAAYSKINETTLCRIRKGRQNPSIKTIGKLVKALEIETSEII